MPSLFRDPPSTSSMETEQTGPSRRPEATGRGGVGGSLNPLNPLDEASEASEASENVQHLANAVSRVRQNLPTGVQTIQEAFSVCRQILDEQLEKGRLERALPNVPIRGDGSARNAILLLLSDAQQRSLFLSVAEERANWSRIRPLFGAPPYNFLRPQDAAAFAASGFARGRVNMSYDETKAAASTAQFGPGQLVDEMGREYRLSGGEEQNSLGLLPGYTLFNAKQGNFLLQVKIKKQSRAKKLALMRSDDRKQVLFPQPGEVVTLRESRGLLSARGASDSRPTDLRVRALCPRALGSSTAALVMSVV